MSGTSGTQASTKGETTSSKSSKSGYDHLDINKLYKGKSTEPVAKTVTQRHGMQTLGKAPPARRGGSTVVKSETTSSDIANSSAPTQPTSLPPNIGQTAIHPPGWSNASLSHPPGPPSPHNAPSVPTTGPVMHDKNWSGGPDRKGNFPSAAAQDSMQRFAQEFPSLDSGGDSGKGPTASASGPSPGTAGHPQMSKSNQDNQYGPGPILRPQTEGSWTQGGGRGMPRPPGPLPPSGASTRDFGLERPNVGGPTPPPMSLGQGGHPPPPLGAFPMQFPPRAPYMYPNNGPPPGPGGFYPPGPGMPRYGMPIPPGAPPPPSSHPQDGPREPPRLGRGHPPPRDLRPASHFASKPIIKQEELERMDELGAQDGGWATVQDDIDYNKKISFSDDEGEDKGKENSGSGRGRGERESKGDRMAQRQDLDKHEEDREPRRSVKILERQQPPPMNDRNERDRGDQRDRDSRYESEREPQSGRYDYENEDDWKRKPAPGFEPKDRDRQRGGRGFREEESSWRSNVNNSRFEEDPRIQRDPREKKGIVAAPANVRIDPRGGPQDFSKQFPSNLPPRLQRQHQQPPSFTQSSNQRKTPSPGPTSGSGNAVNKDRDFRDRDRPTYKILERNRGDSESSKDSGRDVRDRRFGNSADSDPVSGRLRDKDSTKRLSSDSGKMKDDEDTKMSPKADVESGDNDAKTSFRSKPSAFTSSWADEVDDEEYNTRDDDDSRKGVGLRDSLSSHMKRDQVYPDERRPRENTVPRRVIIQQTKVENMRSDIKPEPVIEPKPEPVKLEKPIEKVKSSAWGDRDSMRDKSKMETDPTHKDNSGKENEREIHSSERDLQKTQKSDSNDPSDNKSENAKDIEGDKAYHGGQEGKGSREKLDRDRHYDRYGSGGRYDDKRNDKDGGRTDNRNNNNLRDNRPKARRMDSYDTKRDNRTPDREQYGGISRNSNTDGSNIASRSSQEKDREQDKIKSSIEKSKSGDRLDSLKDKGPEKLDKDDFRRDRDMDKEKEYEKHSRGDRDDYDDRRDRDRGHRGGRGKEKGGYGIYQPRGGSHSTGGHWGSEPNKGRGRGRGNSRDMYDSKPRRMDSDRDEKLYRKEDDRENLRQTDSDSKDRAHDKSSDMSNKGSVEDLGSKKKEKDNAMSQAGNADKKNNKSPGTARRNMRGGTRLQGYGPPSDKTPFSTNQSHKDDDCKEKSSESHTNSKPAPVPLMALGDISPPNMQSKSRHHGGGGGGGGGRDMGGRGRGMPPRMQRDDYSFRTGPGGGNKRGGRSGDAKPLMSINSNEVEGNEWETGSDSGDEESKRTRKDGISNKPGSEKFRQSQNVNRNGSAKTSSNSFNHTQDSANNNKGKGSGAADTTRSSSSNFEIDCYSAHQTNQDLSQHGSVADNLEPLDNESGGFQKKNAGPIKPSGDKGPINAGPKNTRPDPKIVKDRRIKNPPYDPRPNSKQQTQGSLGNVGGWEKNNVPTSLPKDTLSQSSSQSNNSTPAVEPKDVPDTKPNATTIHQPPAASNAPMLDTAGSGPLKTMIFENTNYKSINSNTTAKVAKPVEPKKEGGLPSNMDLGKDLQQLSFGKVVGEENPNIDFGTFNDPATAVSSGVVSQQNHSTAPSQPPSKSMPIGPSARSFVSHQPSPISPQTADLSEKMQSVKRIWEMPTMPSVAEQNSVCVSDDNSFHGGFGADSFKGSDSSAREFGSSLQQPTSGYAPGSSPALSAISKPDSSSSPTSSNLRISKPQQNSLDNQGQSGISSSPFGGYSMPQGSNAFSGMPAVPSPPSVMYNTSQALHTTGPPSGMYQTFPHVDAPQVMGATARTQFQQYPTQAATSGHYGLFLQTPMDYQPMSSYQHQQGNQGPPGQAPSQSSRISPGPMTTSGGGNSAGMIISSTNSLMNMKPQSATGSHPSIPHQVVPGSQQGYSQLGHHHPAAALSHQHHLGAVGPAKGSYSQSGIATQSQTPVFIPFDPQPQVINLGGQNFLSQTMRSGPPTGPPPPATPPVQTLQPSSTYYSGSSGNQSGVYQPGSNQGGSLQQLHVAVAPNHQGLPGMHSGNPQFGLQYPTQLNLQTGYNQQSAASTVSALNLMRNPGPTSHSYMKQPMDLVQQTQLKSTHDPSMINQNTWNSPGFSLNQAFHGGNKTGNNQDRNAGNSIGNQRKGNSHPGNVGSMKYMSSQGPGGYTGQVPQ